MTLATKTQWLVTMVIFFGAAGCGKDAEPPALPARTPFVAFERDFQDFRDWLEVEVPKLEPQGVTHTEGDVRQWINARPAPGATSFPVGTMIVKEVTNEAKKTHQVFAMVKRGGDYNRQGALGWEWFELGERPDESFAIAWRGMNAPAGDCYAGDPLGGCNGCHLLAAKNDYVKSTTLALGPPAKLARH
jgi:hypothetical protein